MYKLFVDICHPDRGIEFILISEKIELCSTSYSTNLVCYKFSGHSKTNSYAIWCIRIFFCFWLKIRRPSSTNFHSKPIDLENLGSLTFCDANQFIKSVTYYLNGPFLRSWNLKYYLSFKISPPPIRFDLQRRSWQNVQVYDDDPLKWQNWVKLKIFWD